MYTIYGKPYMQNWQMLGHVTVHWSCVVLLQKCDKYLKFVYLDPKNREQFLYLKKPTPVLIFSSFNSILYYVSVIYLFYIRLSKISRDIPYLRAASGYRLPLHLPSSLFGSCATLSKSSQYSGKSAFVIPGNCAFDPLRLTGWCISSFRRAFATHYYQSTNPNELQGCQMSAY